MLALGQATGPRYWAKPTDVSTGPSHWAKPTDVSTGPSHWAKPTNKGGLDVTLLTHCTPGIIM
eukprot:gene31988-33914_t